MNAADRLHEHVDRAEDDFTDAAAVIQEITGSGAFMVNLGGGHLALQAVIEGGWIWVTGASDNLFRRSDIDGWLVCTYAGNVEDGEAQDKLRSDETVWDPELDGLRAALKGALARFHR